MLLVRVQAIVLAVAQVVEQVAGARDPAERDERDRRVEQRLLLVELQREDDAREDEQVLDPLPRAQGGTSGPMAAQRLGSGIDEHADQHFRRIQCALDRAQGIGERLRPPAVVPRSVVAPDRVVVCDRSAGVDQDVADGRLDLAPLLDLRAAPGRGQHAK